MHVTKVVRRGEGGEDYLCNAIINYDNILVREREVEVNVKKNRKCRHRLLGWVAE